MRYIQFILITFLLLGCSSQQKQLDETRKRDELIAERSRVSAEIHRQARKKAEDEELAKQREIDNSPRTSCKIEKFTIPRGPSGKSLNKMSNKIIDLINSQNITCKGNDGKDRLHINGRYVFISRGYIQTLISEGVRRCQPVKVAAFDVPYEADYNQCVFNFEKGVKLWLLVINDADISDNAFMTYIGNNRGEWIDFGMWALTAFQYRKITH